MPGKIGYDFAAEWMVGGTSGGCISEDDRAQIG
jgi:hypothetical protein